MDKDKVKALRDALQEAAKGVEQAHGVKVRFGNASYSSDNCCFKVEVMDLSANGTPIRREATTLGKLAEVYGLPKDAVGKEVVIGRGRFRLVGLNTKAQRFPVLAECLASGKTYKFALADVQRALGQPQTGLAALYDRHRGGSDITNEAEARHS
jgi:hypothetical protein